MMNQKSARRNFVKSLMIAPALCSFETIEKKTFSNPRDPSENGKLRISLNAYSFNAPLMAKTMTLDDLMDFCVVHNFDGVDLTGYYFPGYPKVPPDEYIYHIKRKAHLSGLSISGTGIKNDFTNPDPNKRKEDVQLIKQWIKVAAKLGAPVIRIFSGVMIPKEYTWDQIAAWMVTDIRECVDYGRQFGIMVAVQNHNDFLKTADEVEKLIKMVNREWFGLVLDIGSFSVGDPYEQIKGMIPYAVNWQIKENLLVNGKEEKTDLKKLFKIISASGYRGFIPIETLGKGDPKEKVSRFIGEVRAALK